MKFFQCCANIKRSNQIIHLYAICSLIKFLNDFKEETVYIQRITNISFLIAVLFNVIKKMNEYFRQVLVHVQWCHKNDFSFLIFFFHINFVLHWLDNESVMIINKINTFLTHNYTIVLYLYFLKRTSSNFDGSCICHIKDYLGIII